MKRIVYIVPLIFLSIYAMEPDQAKKKDASPKSDVETAYTPIESDIIREDLSPMLVEAWSLMNDSPIANMIALKLVDLAVNKYSELNDPKHLEKSSKILESLGRHRSHRNAIDRLLKAASALEKARANFLEKSEHLLKVDRGLIAQMHEEAGCVLKLEASGIPKDLVVANYREDISIEKAEKELIPLLHLLLAHQQHHRDLCKSLFEES